MFVLFLLASPPFQNIFQIAHRFVEKKFLEAKKIFDSKFKDSSHTKIHRINNFANHL